MPEKTTKNRDGSLVTGPLNYTCGHKAALYITNARGAWEAVIGCSRARPDAPKKCQGVRSLIEFAKAAERAFDEKAAEKNPICNCPVQPPHRVSAHSNRTY